MNPKELNDDLFEVLLKHAVHGYCKDFLTALPNEEACRIDMQFDEKMLRLCAKKERYRLLRRAPVVLKKTAAVLFIALGLSFSIFLFSPIVQAAVKSTVVQWLSFATRYEYTGDAAEITDLTWEPGYIPKGFVLTSAKFSDDAVYREYSDGGDWLIIFDTFKASTEAALLVDNEHALYSQIEINGIPADLYTATAEGESSHLLWVQDGYSLHIMGKLHVNELIKMAEYTKF